MYIETIPSTPQNPQNSPLIFTIRFFCPVIRLCATVLPQRKKDGEGEEKKKPQTLLDLQLYTTLLFLSFFLSIYRLSKTAHLSPTYPNMQPPSTPSNDPRPFTVGVRKRAYREMAYR
jgi:hypothetical protein